MKPSARTLLLALSLLLTLPLAPPADADRLAMRHTALDLPGAPASIVAADVDGDGDRDLVLAVAYTEWDQFAVDESTTMDGVGLVEVMTIVPALADRRELHVLLADPDATDGYRRLPAVPLVATSGAEVLTLAVGPPSTPVVALTDDGLAALHLDGETPRIEPIVDDPPVFAGSGVFLPRLELVHDLDGDGNVDVLVPADDGLAVYLADAGAASGFRAADRIAPPTERRSLGRNGARRHVPRPEVRDVTGDGLPDLLFLDPEKTWRALHVAKNRGDGRFDAPIAVLWEDEEASEGDAGDAGDGADPVWFGDLDGPDTTPPSGSAAAWVTSEEIGNPDESWREEMREAKEPLFRYRIHDAGVRFEPVAMARRTFDAKGYALGTEGSCSQNGEDLRIPGGFLDLDGDGRLDLVSVTLDFSMLQALRILATHTISIGLDFHVHCQDENGGFRRVPNLDLSGKFRLHLDDVRLRRLSLFDGDFDGDGRLDFVQLGRGSRVTIHLGRDGCIYPAEPDLEIRLEDEPRDLALVRVDDLDGDGRSDLLVVQPGKRPEEGVTAPVRLDLYTSTGDSR